MIVNSVHSEDSFSVSARNFTNVVIAPLITIDYKPDNVLDIGDSCFHRYRNVNGACTSAEHCVEVIKDFQRGIQPQICSYIDTRPIVCCPFRDATLQSSTRSPSTFDYASSTASSSGIPAATSRISAIKCEEYAQLGVKRDIVGAFSVGERVNSTVEKPKCDRSGGFIVGGTRTKVGEYPHMAAIGWHEDDGTVQFKCGGSLISYRFVMTAAHCTSQRKKKPSIIRLGEQNIKSDNDGADIQDIAIEAILRHPKYQAISKYDDIALLRLERQVFITDNVRPACLWQTKFIDYSIAVATGWGLTRDRGQPSDELLKVSLKFFDNKQCDSFFERFNALKNGIVESQLCAGDEKDEKDTCQGDSG